MDGMFVQAGEQALAWFRPGGKTSAAVQARMRGSRIDSDRPPTGLRRPGGPELRIAPCLRRAGGVGSESAQGSTTGPDQRNRIVCGGGAPPGAEDVEEGLAAGPAVLRRGLGRVHGQLQPHLPTGGANRATRTRDSDSDSDS